MFDSELVRLNFFR